MLNDLSKRRRGIWNFMFSSRLGTWMVYYEYIEQVSTGVPAAERRVKRLRSFNALDHGGWFLGTLLPTTPVCLFCAQNFRAAKTWVIFLKCFYKLQLHATQQRIIITMCQVRSLFNFQNYLLSFYFWSHLHMKKTRL